MTREEARKAAEIMLAYANGKEIEGLSGSGEYVQVSTPAFSWNNDAERYRIKTDSKYRPFKSAEECWQEMQRHQSFGWLEDKEGGYTQLTSLRDGDQITIGANNGWDLEGIFKNFTFADGTPFGAKENGSW